MRLDTKTKIITILPVAEELIEGGVLIREGNTRNFGDSKEDKTSEGNGMGRGTNQILQDYSEYDGFLISNDKADIAFCGKGDEESLNELVEYLFHLKSIE